jgi:integrase
LVESGKLLKHAELPLSHRPHDLRHTTATYLLHAGVDLRIVMEIMGWSQVSMLSRYEHVLPAMLDDAAARLEAILPGVQVGS